MFVFLKICILEWEVGKPRLFLKESIFNLTLLAKCDVSVPLLRSVKMQTQGSLSKVRHGFFLFYFYFLPQTPTHTENSLNVRSTHT